VVITEIDMNDRTKQTVRTGVAQDFERIRDLVEKMRDLSARYKDHAANLRQLQGQFN
jgi:hypothetical protein